MVKKIFMVLLVVLLLTITTSTVIAIGQKASITNDGVTAQINSEVTYQSGVLGLGERMSYEGKTFDVNVQPDRARETVRSRFTNQQIIGEPVVKQAMINNQQRIVYEFQIQRQARILNLIKVNMNSQAQIPVDSDMLHLNNPWWAALATIEGE